MRLETDMLDINNPPVVGKKYRLEGKIITVNWIDEYNRIGYSADDGNGGHMGINHWRRMEDA
jgi:hypothetical protein